jgi:hypothetical protein
MFLSWPHKNNAATAQSHSPAFMFTIVQVHEPIFSKIYYFSNSFEHNLNLIYLSKRGLNKTNGSISDKTIYARKKHQKMENKHLPNSSFCENLKPYFENLREGIFRNK